MKKRIQYTVVLASVCLASALGLAGTFVLTEGQIAERNQQKIEHALRAVLPTARRFVLLDDKAKGDDRIFKGLDDQGRLVGYAATGAAQGYSSKVRVMVGFGPQVAKLAIVAIRIIYQQETPGLGANVQKKSTSKTLWTVLGLAKESAEIPKSFQDQFQGLTVGSLEVVKTPEEGKILAITGATISSTAVKNAVANAGEKVRKACRG